MVGVARSVAIEKCNLLQYVPKSDSDRCLKCNMNTPLSSWVDRIGVWVCVERIFLQPTYNLCGDASFLLVYCGWVGERLQMGFPEPANIHSLLMLLEFMAADEGQ